MAILRSSDLLAVATTDGFIGFYKVGGNQIIFKHKIFIGGYINALEFTRNGRQLYAVIGKDHKLGRWLPTHKVKSGLLRIDINLPFAGEEVDMLKWK